MEAQGNLSLVVLWVSNVHLLGETLKALHMVPKEKSLCSKTSQRFVTTTDFAIT